MNLNCYSYYEFNNLCQERGYSDENIPEDIAFISICNTHDCQVYYMEEEFEHYFKEPHLNVINLDFDDVSEDEVFWEGHTFYGIQISQAYELFEFIEKNIGKEIWVHCHAGHSRSQAVVQFILDCYPEYNYQVRQDNPPLTPNIDVLSKLKRVWREEKNKTRI